MNGAALGSGSTGPSRPLSPCTCAAVRSVRVSGASAPAHTGMSVRPAISSVTSALRVVLSSVWLPATVVMPTSSTSGDASARRIAIASSWPGSQSMTIFVLTGERPPPRRSAWSFARPDGMLPAHQRMHARRSDSSRSRPSRSETTRHAVNASPAPVPSTACTRGGVARATSTPSSRSTAPSAPCVTQTSPPRLPSASSSSRLTIVSSASGASARAGAALRKKRGVTSATRATVSAGISCWHSTGSPGTSESSSGPSSAFAPGATTIVVSPSASTVMSATPVGASFGSQRSRTPASRSPASASPANTSFPTAPTMRTSAPSRAAATAWFAPFPPGPRENDAPVTVSPARGSRSLRTTRSRLIEPTTVSLGAAMRRA